MKRLSILLILLCGCSPGLRDDTCGPEDDVRVVFGITKAPVGTGDADMTGFRYLTYDHVLGSWSGELGGEAVRSGGPQGPFLPADASRVYWPEGRTYSFYAAGYNDLVTVGEGDVEFGSAYTIYSSGASAILTLKNPGHNVDWLAAKTPGQEKIDGIPLTFKHVCSRLGRLTIDLASYRQWLVGRELDIADVKLIQCTLSDAAEQSYIFSSSTETMFNRESWDYTAAAAVSLSGERSLGLENDGCSIDLGYYAFPGSHTLSLRIQTVDYLGNQCIDDRTLSGVVTLPMGADCELMLDIPPESRDLTIEVICGIAAWDSGGSGTVNQ